MVVVVVKEGRQFLTLIPVVGFFIYFSTYMYCTVFPHLGIFQRGRVTCHSCYSIYIGLCIGNYVGGVSYCRLCMIVTCYPFYLFLPVLGVLRAVHPVLPMCTMHRLYRLCSLCGLCALCNLCRLCMLYYLCKLGTDRHFAALTFSLSLFLVGEFLMPVRGGRIV